MTSLGVKRPAVRDRDDVTRPVLDDIRWTSRLVRQNRCRKGEGRTVTPHFLPRLHVTEVSGVPVLMLDDDALVGLVHYANRPFWRRAGQIRLSRCTASQYSCQDEIRLQLAVAPETHYEVRRLAKKWGIPIAQAWERCCHNTAACFDEVGEGDFAVRDGGSLASNRRQSQHF